MSEQIMPIGVFASAGAGLGAAIDKVRGLGVKTVQIRAPGPEGCTRDTAAQIARRFKDAGISVSLSFLSYRGESYASIQAVMGWEDCHLHQFGVGGVRYRPHNITDGRHRGNADEL